MPSLSSSAGDDWDSSFHGRREPANARHADQRNDFWVTYLKRRRSLHTEAHESYTSLTNVIMLPALLSSAIASVLAVTLKDNPAGPYVVAAVSTASTFLIGVQQHLKVANAPLEPGA